jgi:hypothetical protein
MRPLDELALEELDDAPLNEIALEKCDFARGWQKYSEARTEERGARMERGMARMARTERRIGRILRRVLGIREFKPARVSGRVYHVEDRA